MLLLPLLPLCLPGPPQDPSALDLRRFVPADAYLAVSTAPWKDIRARAEANAWRRFFADEAWFDVADYLGFALEDILNEETGGAVLRLASAVDGGVTLFLYPVQEDVGLGLLIDGGGASSFPAFAGELLSSFAGEAELLGQAPSGAQARWLRCEVGASGSVVDCAFLAGDVLGIFSAPRGAAAVARAEAVLAALDAPDEARGLLACEAYRKATAATPEGHQPAVSAFVSLGDMMDRVLADEDLDADDERMISILGLSELDWIYADADLGAGERIDMRLRLHVPTGTLLGDLMDFFGPAPREFVSLLPPESVGVGLANYDVAAAFEHLLAFIGEWYPEALSELDEGLESTALEFGFDLREDVFGQFTGRFADFSMLLPEGEIVDPLGLTSGSEALNQAGALLLEIRRPDEFEATLSTALGLVGMEEMVETEELHGAILNHLGLGPMGAHWAFVDDKLVVSLYPSPVRAVLRLASGTEEPSAAGLAFAREVERHPDASGISLAQTRTAVEAMLSAVSAMGKLASYQILDEDDDEMSAFLLELGSIDWPDPALAAEYFHGTLGTILTRRADVLELHFQGR